MTWIYCKHCKNWHYTEILTVNRCPYCGQEREVRNEVNQCRYITTKTIQNR